jgi:TonB family protein
MIGLLAVAAALPTATYVPSNKWTLDYQENLCLLTRPFAPASSASSVATTLGFRQAPGDSTTEVVVLVADDDDAGQRRGIVGIAFPSGARRIPTLGVSYRIPGGRQRLLRFLTARANLDFLAHDKEITIEEVGQPAKTFKVDGADRALRALAGCEGDQLRAWGVDPDKMATPPKPVCDVAKWFSFPGLAAANRLAGTTTLRWTIDTQGKIGECTIIRSSGTPLLDNEACGQIRKRGAYQPAIGKDGKPMMWMETRQIIWSLG